MQTIEQSVKAQFATVFASSAWHLYKQVAESHLREAAELRMNDMRIASSLRLLARNSRKRLLIGIGVELLLKAVYLKHGFVINKPPRGSALKFPFTRHEAAGHELIADQTFMLADLIDHLSKVVQLQQNDLVLKGLKIAKVFRNKEGHTVTNAHVFDTSNYADIAASLMSLYEDAFAERLSLCFSLAPNEAPVWRISRLQI